MQLWTPPTPPQDDNDIYIDSVMCLMYDTTPIPESKLPPVYVRKERKRHKTDPSGKCLFRLVLRFNPDKLKKLEDFSYLLHIWSSKDQICRFEEMKIVVSPWS